jgi:hypothetical protein
LSNGLLTEVEKTQKATWEHAAMQTAHHFRFYNRAIRTKIGETLRTLFVPTEPTPNRLLELLHALDQPKGGDPSGTLEKLDEGVEKIPGGYVVRDADGQALVYVYSQDDESEALTANFLTEDEALRVAINVAKLTGRLRRDD